MGGDRRLTLGEPQRRQLPVGVERETERRGAVADRLAVGCHELGVAAHGPGDIRGSGQPANRRSNRLRNGLTAGGALLSGRSIAVEGRLTADLEADVLVDTADQRGERVAEGVGEHQRPGNERNPEPDRQRRKRQAQLAGQQTGNRHLTHLYLPSFIICSSTESAVGEWSSPITAPSPGTPPGPRTPPPADRG